MKRLIVLVPLVLLCSVATASAAYIDGNVTLYPIDFASFRSVGWATYYNDLSQQESAAMSGEHVVTEVYPGSIAFTVPVQGDGSYFYSLEGPTDPGACYGTSLHAIARPAIPPINGQTQFEGTWYGYTQQCDPRSPEPIRYYLAVWISLDGYVTPGGGTGYHDAGETVIVSTSAPPGYEFLGWSGASTSTEQSTEVYMDRDKTVTANWASPPPPPTDPPSDCSADWVSGCSPIVVNFTKGNYQLTGTESPVLFDIAAIGRPIRIGWTAAGADEAFLCLDRNYDGRITSGAELFGNATPLKSGRPAGNGFLALAQYDDNHDSVIDANDAVWPQLLLWRDRNHDGVSQEDELLPVAGSGIVAISLDYHWTGRRDASGNLFKYESKVWMVNAGGEAMPHPVYDIFFVRVP